MGPASPWRTILWYVLHSPSELPGRTDPRLPRAIQLLFGFASFLTASGGFPDGSSGKEPVCQCRRCKRLGLDPWIRKISWGRKWLPTPAFLPGESHGLRSLAGYSPWRHKELDTTEQLSMHALPLTPTFWDHILDHSPLPSAKFWFQDSGLGELKPRHPFTAGCGLGL